MILLFFMVIAGLGSLLFASSSLPAVLWNFFWYWVMGNVAISVFDDPSAGWLGIGFAITYVLRSRRPNRGPGFVFKTGSWGGMKYAFESGGTRTSPAQANPMQSNPMQSNPSHQKNSNRSESDRGDVIEAEVIEAHTTQKDQS
jgi:hypothetical protein